MKTAEEMRVHYSVHKSQYDIKINKEINKAIGNIESSITNHAFGNPYRTDLNYELSSLLKGEVILGIIEVLTDLGYTATSEMTEEQFPNVASKHVLTISWKE